MKLLSLMLPFVCSAGISFHAGAQQIPPPQDQGARSVETGTAIQRPRPTNQGQGQTGAMPALPPLPSPFAAIIDQSIPLSPEQIREVKEKQDKVKRAAADPSRTPPKPRIRNLNVDLSPGSVPPLVRLAAGNGTGVAFMDMSGAPWPVEAIDLGNKDDFTGAFSVPGTNVVTLNATSEYGQGNLLVFLKGMNTPVVVTMLIGQQDVDYRLDLRVPQRGPNARPDPTPIETSVKFNPVLGNILDGIVADSLKPVNVNGESGMAWRNGNRLFLRTTYAIMSPKPIEMTSSQDGTRAYELEYTPLVMVSRDGRQISLKISE